MKGRGTPKTLARRSRPRDIGFALASCAVLGAYNNVIHRHPWHHRRYVTLNACATGATVAAAAANGLTASDMGFGRAEWPPGWLAIGAAALVGAGWIVVAAVPATRPVLNDKRITSLDGRAVAYQAVVRIPIGTVLWEETAFRGVLQAALRRVLPRPAAIAVTSAVFGIWHIRPTMAALRINQVATGRRAELAGVAAAVAGTAAAGVLLSWLRDRSSSVAAPVLLHLTANCGGALAARWVAGPRAAQRLRAMPR
jgi:uncharacterized protein